MGIEKARLIIANKINAQPEEIIFTSGGTETNNLVLTGLINYSQKSKKHFIISSVEHPSIYEVGKYYETKGIRVTYVPVDKNGIVDPDDIKKSLEGKTLEEIVEDDRIGLMTICGKVEVSEKNPIGWGDYNGYVYQEAEGNKHFFLKQDTQNYLEILNFSHDPGNLGYIKTSEKIISTLQKK